MLSVFNKGCQGLIYCHSVGLPEDRESNMGVTHSSRFRISIKMSNIWTRFCISINMSSIWTRFVLYRHTPQFLMDFESMLCCAVQYLAE